MAGMCCGVVGETEAQATVEPSGQLQSRRRRMEIHQLKLLAADMVENSRKRIKLETQSPTLVDEISASVSVPRKCENAVQSCEMDKNRPDYENISGALSPPVNDSVLESSRFGSTLVCGRRRDMEDAVAIHPSFCRSSPSQNHHDLQFYGVYDGHGCSHVAMKCKDRMHEIVRDEIEDKGEMIPWRQTMAKSFSRMDQEVTEWSNGVVTSNCRCELQTPQCDAVGSTAVVAVVTPDKIVVSNCGDSRAVLCRNGVAIPLSTDHKPDRPDELARIEVAGGRVIYWDGARVLGVLAMSRAIGDNYLKPYVIPEPEVTVTERTSEDECLILASDGLWDVVSNDVACSVARTCLSSNKPPSPPRSPGNDVTVSGGECSDKACSDASILLTKLALARRSTDNVSVVVVDLRRNL